MFDHMFVRNKTNGRFVTAVIFTMTSHRGANVGNDMKNILYIWFSHLRERRRIDGRNFPCRCISIKKGDSLAVCRVPTGHQQWNFLTFSRLFPDKVPIFTDFLQHENMIVWHLPEFTRVTDAKKNIIAATMWQKIRMVCHFMWCTTTQ